MRRSSTYLFSTALLAWSLTFGVAARAQQTDPAAPAPAASDAVPMRPRMDPDKMASMLAKKLALTDAQKTQIQPILADRQQKMHDLQADTSSRPRQKMGKMKEIMADSDKQINAILTPDQQKQYAALEEQTKEKMKERRQEKKQGM